MVLNSLLETDVRVMRILKLKSGIPLAEILKHPGIHKSTLDSIMKKLEGHCIIVKKEVIEGKGGRPRHLLSLTEAGEIFLRAFDLANNG